MKCDENAHFATRLRKAAHLGERELLMGYSGGLVSFLVTRVTRRQPIHEAPHARTSSPRPANTADMTALATSVLPEMMTPQVSSGTAHWDAPRTRPTCSAVRPVRRSLWAEIDTAPRESPYYEHNAWLSTSATEGPTWYAPHLHPSQPLPHHHCDSLRRCLPMPLRPRKAFLLPQSAEV